jgi:ElaB/YqjD/DUF883 family membrane-anchored ribosome-binding protein/gas vesicle protein
MGEESTRLRQEIETARGDLARDVDRLTEKTSPSRIVGRRVEATKSGIGSIKDKVMGTSSDLGHAGHEHASSAAGTVKDTASGAVSAVGDAAHGVVSGTQTVAEKTRSGAQGHPLVAGAVAFGVGYLISSLLPASDAERAAAAKAKEAAQEYGQPVVEQAKEVASNVGHQVGESAQEHVQGVKEHAQESIDLVKHETQDAAGTVRGDVKQHASEVR